MCKNLLTTNLHLNFIQKQINQLELRNVFYLRAVEVA